MPSCNLGVPQAYITIIKSENKLSTSLQGWVKNHWFTPGLYLLHKQAVHGLFDHENLGRCCQCFRAIFLSEFLLFCQKVDFFHPLNRNDDFKESESGLGVIGILGVGVGVGILGILGVGVGPYTFRLNNPAFITRLFSSMTFLAEMNKRYMIF